MAHLISILLVITGMCCLAAALKPAFWIARFAANRNWHFLILLILLFITGYAVFLYKLLSAGASPIELVISLILGGGGVFVIMVISLSRKSIEHEQILTRKEYHSARHDSLTGLSNRAAFAEDLGEKLADAKKTGSRFAVLMFDLDRFKEINDTMGHAIGDKILRELAKRLKAIPRQYGRVSRLSGDEFVMIIPGQDESLAIEAANYLADVVEQPYILEGLSLIVDMSVGISFFPDDGDNQEHLLRCADVAMYLAKRNNQHYMIYSKDQDTLSTRNLEMISRVREALANDEFELYYQPVLEAKELKLHAFEVLIRWPQKDGSFIPPSTFIPAVEKSRFFNNITRWVISQSIRQATALNTAHEGFSININLSATDLSDNELTDYIRRCAAELDYPVSNLVFEITESAIMNDRDRAFKTITNIIGLGAKIAMDDFGTGFSSLSLLRDFPTQIIKLDTSFVTGMMSNPEDKSIIQSMIYLGHNIDRIIAAEGVEDKETADSLISMGCDLLQGYYFAKPMNYTETLEWLKLNRNP